MIKAISITNALLLNENVQVIINEVFRIVEREYFIAICYEY